MVACPGGPEQLPNGRDAIRALSWREVDRLRWRFATLDVRLNLTSENYVDGSRRQLHAIAVAGSRVILYRELPSGERQVVKRSEVAIGDLRSPLGAGTSAQFIDDTASWMLDYALDGTAEPRSWFGQPAMTDLPMGTPGKVESLGDNGSPFGFASGARRARRGDPVLGGDPVRLIAPAGSHPESARWVEVPTGLAVADDEITIATYGDELVRLVLHPESKMLGPDGLPCRYTTRGLLTPRPVLVRAVHLVGKEGNRIDEVATGEVTDPDEVLIDYGSDEWEAVILPILRGATVTEVARRAGMDRAGLSDYLRVTSPRRPPKKTQGRLRKLAGLLVTGARYGDAPGSGARSGRDRFPLDMFRAAPAGDRRGSGRVTDRPILYDAPCAEESTSQPASEWSLPATNGVLASQHLFCTIRAGIIHGGDYEVPPENIRPASLDLCLGEMAYGLRCSFLAETQPVSQKYQDLEIEVLDLHREGAVLSRGGPILSPSRSTFRFHEACEREPIQRVRPVGLTSSPE